MLFLLQATFNGDSGDVVSSHRDAASTGIGLDNSAAESKADRPDELEARGEGVCGGFREPP
jgi:hypothetical protein